MFTFSCSLQSAALALLVCCLCQAGILSVQGQRCQSSGSNPGYGVTFTLKATQDVWLEGSGNKNYHNFLIIGKHPQFPKKRTLIQFENVSRQCCRCVRSAKMYLYYWYAHKASWQSDQSAPYINRILKVHQLERHWIESQATSLRPKYGSSWNQPYVALDGTDAYAQPQSSVPIFNYSSGDYVEFDITDAVRRWLNGEPNYGLLIWATNENVDGRDLRFYSQERPINTPYLKVECDY